jgi:Zn-dependent M28 family amino/carboxypeptidase
MQLAAAERVFAAAGQNFAALAERARRPGFRAVPLGLKAGVSFSNTIRREKSKNVIGVLPGRTRPNDYVMHSAHWDHLGRCDAVNGDDICNGALDNATGTAGLVALAEAHVRAGAAERTMVFLAVTAEESGLLGSKYYAENPVFPLARTVGGVNMDGLNIVGATRDFVVTGAGKSQLEDMVRALVEAQGRTVVPEPNPERGFYYRSDHFSFARLGVPMFYGEGGETLVNGGREAGARAAQDYTDNRYHKPQDEYDPNWNWDGALQDLTIYYQLGRQLAEGTMWPEWYPGTEFRAIRERSRAGQ